MSSPFYFFDQFSSASHIGGVYRSKRNSKDLNQALYHVKLLLAAEDHDSNKSRTTKSGSIRKQTGDTNLQTILRQCKSPIQPEIITKELDTILQSFDEKSKITSSSSPPKSPQHTITNNEDQLINVTPRQSKISLPSSLILRLNATWSDLIKNTEYKSKVWHTKAGEEAWRNHIQRKRTEQIKSEKQQFINNHRIPLQHRKSSRISITSLTNGFQRQSSTANPQIRGSRSPSRASFLSTSGGGGMIQDNLQSLKTIHQGALENATESHKHAIHVEFKLSTQTNKTARLTKQKIALFDVPKPEVNVDKEMIISTQYDCKRLLAETKQKILATTNDLDTKHSKIRRLWFYEDNQFIRNKNDLLASNELNRRQKSKFVLSILRHEIPENYNIDIDIPETKRKCYIEFVDGTSQIYYPSGRLAVLRLRSPLSTTLFFDDTNITAKQLLGLVTSTGNVLSMQPTFHARFVTNNQHEYAYLCNGKTGVIEKQLQWYSTNNSRRQSLLTDEDNINIPLYENTVQLQLNSCMQLEYNSSSDIRFAFICQNEEFKFQLGVQFPTESPILMDLTTAILATKRLFGDKKIQTKRSSSIISNDIVYVPEKQQIQSQKLTDEQVDFHQLPIMRELIMLRKRIRHVCDSWLKECRTTLGIMDIDAYCLSDLPPSSPQPSNDIDHSENTKQSDYVPLLTRRASLINDSIKPMDKQQLTRRTAKISRSNVITDSIEQFIPRSNAGQAIKQRIYTKTKITSTTLPAIKSH